MHQHNERGRRDPEIDAVVMAEERGDADYQTEQDEPQDGRATRVPEHRGYGKSVEDDLRVIVERGSHRDGKNRGDEGRHDGRRKPRRHEKERGGAD
jgi:hypothetical protein